MTTTTTTKKKAPAKRTTATKSAANKPSLPKAVAPKEPVKKTYDKSDLIPCTSIFPGTCILTGRKSGNIYSWDEIGEVSEVEYQDLMAEIVNKRSSFIYDPLILIDDIDIVNSRPTVKALYDSLVSVDEIKDVLLSKSPAEIKKYIKRLPIGLKETTKGLVATMIASQELSDYRTIRAVDEILTTELTQQLEMFS